MWEVHLVNILANTVMDMEGRIGKGKQNEMKISKLNQQEKLYI